MAKDGVIESGGEFAVKDYTDTPPAPLIDAA
jgi:hypothetical protein